MSIIESKNGVESTSKFVTIHGAIIEYLATDGVLTGIKVHQPCGLIKDQIEEIYAIMGEHVGAARKLVEEPPRYKGGVYILKWKVIYE